MVVVKKKMLKTIVNNKSVIQINNDRNSNIKDDKQEKQFMITFVEMLYSHTIFLKEKSIELYQHSGNLYFKEILYYFQFL